MSLPRPAPAPDARDRLRGLKPAQAEQLRRAMQLLAAGDRLMGSQLLLDLLRSAPDHPEVLRCHGERLLADGEFARAAESLARSHALRPGGLDVLCRLAAAHEGRGAAEAALAALGEAGTLAKSASDWRTLSIELDRHGHVEQAAEAIERALALAPDDPVSLLQRARCAAATGRAAQAAEACRALIARGQLSARAWFALTDLKVVPLADGELERLRADAAAAGGSAEEREMLAFALGKALEDAGRLDEAFGAWRHANALAATTHPWDGAAFDREVETVRRAFETDGAAADHDAGREVIFLVGLPRSGTTLVEQVLAAHPQVEGASELPYLGQVLAGESRRRGRPLAAWAPQATPGDWARLGREYLAVSARWRTRRPVHTDKLPGNWLYAGAALRMLPNARVVDCRRDPVETCWSCFKQLFGPGMVHFTYSFEGLAGYWHAYDQLSRFWAGRLPGRFHVQGYEALVNDPPAQVRALLDACGLPFDAACLESHRAQRAIRTPSALQVRQPMRTVSAPGARYGARLDPLRELLATG
jgi:tetratricopeptide (TPR) repeat protein